MNDPQLSSAGADAAADATCALLAGGYLRIYKPDAQALLAELRFSSPAFGPASGGIAVAKTIAPEEDAKAPGRAGWFKAIASNGRTVVFEGSVGTENSDIDLNDTRIERHAPVRITQLVYAQART